MIIIITLLSPITINYHLLPSNIIKRHFTRIQSKTSKFTKFIHWLEGGGGGELNFDFFEFLKKLKLNDIAHLLEMLKRAAKIW